MASLACVIVDSTKTNKKAAKMGLMDRDYMHENRRQRPFSPPPERFSTLGKVIVFVVALFVLYKIADWKLTQQAASLAAKPTPAAAPKTIQRPAEAPATTFPPVPPDQSPSNQTANTQTVTKCVVNGKTSYADSACPQGAVKTQVTTRTDQNLMTAVRPTAVTQTEEAVSQPLAVARNNPSLDAAAKKAECQALNAQIEHLDSLSRQPQSAQMQDWIKDERKKARDQQFRLPCR
jgi:hypothetical protein